MSTHRIEVIPVVLEKHPNADSLSIVSIPNTGYKVVVKTQDWVDKQIGIYIEPDYLVPSNRDEFKFLEQFSKTIENQGITGYRIKCKRLRGVMSMGLLIPAVEGAKVGDNVMEQLGIIRYDPPIPMSTKGECVKPPAGIRPCYDVESAYKFKSLFTIGEEVVATEKVHGANARYCWHDGQMYCGSRTEWKKESEGNIWWNALKNVPIEAFCKEHPELTLYGEVYGQVQDLTYGVIKNKIMFIAFDLMKDGSWIDCDEARELGKNLPWAPVIYRGAWSEEIFNLADGHSEVAAWNGVKQIREGIVIKPVKERSNIEIGRTQLKIVSNDYLTRS
jgi:RNA ligase (TIGR02306 family)